MKEVVLPAGKVRTRSTPLHSLLNNEKEKRDENIIASKGRIREIKKTYTTDFINDISATTTTTHSISSSGVIRLPHLSFS